MKVRDIMTTDLATANLDTTLDQVADMMRGENVGAIPVVDDGELRGIVTDRDIVVRCIAEGKEPSDTSVEDVLTDQLQTIEPDVDVEDAARLMADRQIRRLPVVEEGELIGIISIGDLAVKESDDDLTGETLEEVSQGVKQQRARSSQSGGQQRGGEQRASGQRQAKQSSRQQGQSKQRGSRSQNQPKGRMQAAGKRSPRSERQERGGSSRTQRGSSSRRRAS